MKDCSKASPNNWWVLGDSSEENWAGWALAGEVALVNKLEAFNRILVSLHEVALNRDWSRTTALIDDSLNTHGSCMGFAEGNRNEDILIYFAWCFMHGQRQWDLELDYFQNYYAIDERIPRLRSLPDGRLFRTTEIYTEKELKTSATYNEVLARNHGANSINVRLDGPNNTHIVWVINDPVGADNWSDAQLKTIRQLLPHIRHTVHVQQALAGAGALGTSLTTLLDATGLGIVQLDARGRIVAANDRARELLSGGKGLFDENGFLHARSVEDDADLQGLLRRALPRFGAQSAGGSMLVRRSFAPSLVLHVNPVGRQQADAGVWPVAALVLVLDPASQTRINPAVAAEALGLTGMESRVAVLLAEGMSVREIAAAMGRKESTIRTHVKHMFTKHRLSRQADMVRLVLALAGTSETRR